MEMGENNVEAVGQSQIHDLIFNNDLGWREIIFDLINTEQLDPWAVNISFLAHKFFIRD